MTLPIWSLSRKFQRSFCPRSAVLRYCVETDVTKISDEKFLREILLCTMRREFYRGETNPETLSGMVMARFQEEFRNIAGFRSRRQLASLTGRCDFNEKGRELENRLYTYLHNIRPHWETLLAAAPESRLPIDKVLDVNIRQWRCFGSPLCAFFDRGKLCFVELRGGDFAECEAETAMLHRVYALNHCGRDPGSVESKVLDYHRGVYRSFGGSDISDAIRAIKEEIAAWQDLRQKDWLDIPENKGNCPYCSFAGVCGRQ